MLQLCYSALSPFCRKVRMAMDHMQLDYEVFDSGDVKKFPAFNPRAEIPILQDGATTVRNSATIVDYLHRRFPDAPSLFPTDIAAYAEAKEWELIADTMVDPIVTNIGIWAFADLRPMPDGLHDAARNDLNAIYDRLNAQLETRDFVAGDISIGDLALYPHLVGGRMLGLPADKQKHANIIAWLNRIKNTGPGKADLAETLQWWKTKDTQDVETDKINWGTYRLEWFLAHGFHDYFMKEIERDAVIWSVGPNNNARNSPLANEDKTHAK